MVERAQSWGNEGSFPPRQGLALTLWRYDDCFEQFGDTRCYMCSLIRVKRTALHSHNHNYIQDES